MSFSSEIKNSIINARLKYSCCRRALLQGIIASKGYTDENGLVYINFENADAALYTATLVKEFFGKDANLESSPRGGRCKRLVFDSKAARTFISDIDTHSALYAEKCTLCSSAFLKGVFLACGRISDPSKQFCLEFSLGNRDNLINQHFDELGFEFKRTERKSEKIVYTKNSSVMEDFFSSADLNDVTYTIINVKIKNDLLNNANRVRNFETVNISKAVDAAGSQYTLIKKIIENNLLSFLPDELHYTAKLRYENPDMSLAQLAIHSVPPISKSGITHRIQRIMKIGKELIAKYNL